MTPLSVWTDNVRLVMIVIGGVLLLLAAILALVRMSRGPTTLDRAVASDLIVGITIAALAMEEVVHQHVMTVPIMLVLALVGFAGPVAIARFVIDPSRTPNPDAPGAAAEQRDAGDAGDRSEEERP